MEKIEKKIVGWKVAQTTEEQTLETPELPKANEISFLSAGETISIVKNVRPRRLDNTWRLKPPHAEHSLRVTLVANITPEGKKVPYELLLNTKNPETFMHLQAHALVISSYFREAYKTGISLNSLIQTLKDVFDPKYPSYRVKLKDSDEKPTLVHSIVAEIGYVIEEFYEECLAWNYTNSTHETPPTEEEIAAVADTKPRGYVTWTNGEPKYHLPSEITNPCPKCGSQLTKQSGCDTCLDCGYSKCG